MPNIPLAMVPGHIGTKNKDELRRDVIETTARHVIDNLTVQPAPKGRGGEPGARDIVFKGGFNALNKFFYDNEWSDGLPIVPPTHEAVSEFLQFTDRDPNEVLGVILPDSRAATIWSIAVNGVMAGCSPECMPLLIALVEAIADNTYNLANIGTTWGVFPFLLVNGPAVKKMGIESGAHLISKGNNPAIGRAMGLIIKNIAGYRPGRNYMGTFGYPQSFTVAENDDENPWDPFHVEQGFKKEDSTVTACASVTWGWAPAIYGTPDKTAAQTALEFLSIELTKKPCLARFAERGPRGFKNMVTILMAPSVAKALAGAGYTKQMIREYIYEHARVTYRELEFLLKYGHSEAFTIPDAVERGIYPKEYLVGPDDLVRVVPSPDVIHIVVCGDPNRNRTMVLWGGYVNPVTKKMTFPA